MKAEPRMQVFLGATGTGKTTAMAALLVKDKRKFIIDPTRDDEKFARYPEARTMAEVVEMSMGRTFSLRLVTSDPLACQFVCWLAWERRNCLVAIDEIHKFVPSSHLCIPPIFQTLCLEGRHRNVKIYATSQRPANVHKDFLGEAAAHRIHVFRINDPWALKPLREIIPNVDEVRDFPVGKKLSWPR